MTQQSLTTIGVLGSKNDNIIYHIIKEMFIKSNYDVIYDNKRISILANKQTLILIVELTPQTINHVYNLGLDIHILVHKSIEIADYENSFVKTIASKAKYIIMNIDDEESRCILDDNIDGLILTYGINQKATLTASSFNFSSNSQFNLCLQREYKNLEDVNIEPMELPVTLNLIGKSNMYYGLGAIACGLTCGIDINDIKNALLSIKGTSRYLEKIYERDYMIVDNRCSSPLDYSLALEEIQNIKYKSAYIINGIEIDEGIYTIKKNLKVILNWVPILDIKKIFFYIDKKEELIINNIKLLLDNCKIEYEMFFELEKCIYNSIRTLGKGDLLLLLGNESLKEGKEIIKLLI
ncbi:MAG: hypothetical protein GX320_02480 [Tissierellia bacterium]|nr:hypothetical protein [Tissierellia bacterium]